MAAPYEGDSADAGVPGLTGKNSAAAPTRFRSEIARSVLNIGVWGEATAGFGVYGVTHAASGAGVYGVNATNSVNEPGVLGENPGGDGVVGKGHRGVVGKSSSYQGVYGHSQTNAGVVGESQSFHAVYAISHSANDAGVYATNDAGGNAAIFDGPTAHTDVFVSGDVQLLGGDVAEDFDIEDGEEILPGSVVSIGSSGGLCLARRPYDTTVVGIVAGAAGFRPGLRLDRTGANRGRLPVALVGKVMCLVDAGLSPVRAGDLLSSSATPGHAMRAADDRHCVGAIVGKALRSVDRGRSLVPVLAILQ